MAVAETQPAVVVEQELELELAAVSVTQLAVVAETPTLVAETASAEASETQPAVAELEPVATQLVAVAVTVLARELADPERALERVPVLVETERALERERAWALELVLAADPGPDLAVVPGLAVVRVRVPDRDRAVVPDQATATDLVVAVAITAETTEAVEPTMVSAMQPVRVTALAILANREASELVQVASAATMAAAADLVTTLAVRTTSVVLVVDLDTEEQPVASLVVGPVDSAEAMELVVQVDSVATLGETAEPAVQVDLVAALAVTTELEVQVDSVVALAAQLDLVDLTVLEVALLDSADQRDHLVDRVASATQPMVQALELQ